MARIGKKVLVVAPVFGVFALLGGCVETMPKPEAGTRPVACTMEYVPVCGAKGNERRTFSNACMAKAEGFSVDRAGTCEG